MKYIIYILALSVTSCVINDYNCSVQLEDFERLNNTGVILDKYNDYSNHGKETAKWRFKNKTINIAFITLAHKKQLYDVIEIGDSIYNEAGSAKFHIYRNNALVKVVELSCPK